MSYPARSLRDHRISTRPAPLAAAHRGDVERHRENTLAAVRSAVEAGADFVEVDVRVTRDGEVILLHDPTLDRLWGEPSHAADMDWIDVAALGEGTDRIPLLAEALAAVGGTACTLLIDIADPECAGPALRVVREGHSGARVAWCGHLEAMRIVRDLDPAAAVWLPWNQRGLPPADLVDRLRPEFVNSEYAVLSTELIRAVHGSGARVACWTVDNEDAMRWVLDLGVDAVTTNRLRRFQGVVAAGPETWEDAPHPACLAGDELVAAAALAHELAHWAIAFTRDAKVGDAGSKAHPADNVIAVDLAVERHVREVIAARLPGHLVVGGELGGTAPPGTPCWYLDPVDGTANLANGVPWTAFSLALAIDRQPVLAVVGDVWQGQVLSAVAGWGAELDGTRLDLQAPTPNAGRTLAGKVVGTELLAHRPWLGIDAFTSVLADRYCTLRIMGSGALTLAGVAAGRGAGSVVERFSPIDHLAATLIVREAGGLVLDEHGDETVWPAAGGVLVARPEHAAELYAAWSVSRRAGREGTNVV
ncbi:inositol monophosphatase family protein [Sinomonas susongensis]|uniref:inositol monophosphatase family protein n=1 Tax=Sinomonas susongensis TaxID=1324851 RepID=UPI00110949AB|nr:inositol monophosphatase family protein [Sinomonas susongensis]